MKSIIKIAVSILAMTFSVNALSGFNWHYISNELIYTDSGYLYIKANELSTCPYSRVVLDLNTAGTFEKSLYSQILAYYLAGKPMEIVTDLDTPNCIVKGLREYSGS